MPEEVAEHADQFGLTGNDMEIVQHEGRRISGRPVERHDELVGEDAGRNVVVQQRVETVEASGSHPVDGREEIRPELPADAVALVEREPRDGPRERRRPVGDEARLARPGGTVDDHHSLRPRGIELVDQPLPWEVARGRRRDAQFDRRMCRHTRRFTTVCTKSCHAALSTSTSRARCTSFTLSLQSGRYHPPLGGPAIARARKVVACGLDHESFQRQTDRTHMTVTQDEPTADTAWWSLTPEDAAARLSVDADEGLSADEVRTPVGAVRTERDRDRTATEHMVDRQGSADQPDEHHVDHRGDRQLRDRSGAHGRDRRRRSWRST